MPLAVDGARENAVQSINHLVDFAVEMRRRHTGLRRHGEFEHHDVARTLRLVDEEFQLRPPMRTTLLASPSMALSPCVKAVASINVQGPCTMAKARRACPSVSIEQQAWVFDDAAIIVIVHETLAPPDHGSA